MNYLILKEIMTTIIAKFRCQECATPATENSFSIRNLSGKNLELSYECPHCKTRAILSARFWEVKKEFLQTEQWKNMLQKAMFHKNLKNTDAEKGISSEEIIEIENMLSKNTTVTDFINGE